MPKAKLTTKGQITVPRPVRERLGLRTGDELEFVENSDGFLVRRHVPDSVFRKYRGDLHELAGRDPDQLVQDMRGR